MPYAFVEGPQGVRTPKFSSEQQHGKATAAAAHSDTRDDEHAASATTTAREDWLVVLAKATPEKKEWVRRPGK